MLLASGLALVGVSVALGAMWSASQEHERFELEVDEVRRDGAKKLEVEGERLELERLAWRATGKAPAEALALFRASASLAAAPEAELTRPEVLELPGRGATARVLPTTHQPMWMEASAEHDVLVSIMLDGTLQTWRVSTGEPLRTIDTRHGTGRRRLSVNREFTRVALEMPWGEGAPKVPRPIKVFDLTTGELAYTPSYGQSMYLIGFREGDGRGLPRVGVHPGQREGIHRDTRSSVVLRCEDASLRRGGDVDHRRSRHVMARARDVGAFVGERGRRRAHVGHEWREGAHDPHARRAGVG